MRRDGSPGRFNPWRFYLVLTVLAILISGLIVRLVYLTTVEHSFLVGQGNDRTNRIIAVPALRGMITDRHGIPLAISSPINAVWADPKDFKGTEEQLQKLGELLSMPLSHLQSKMKNRHLQFVYLSREVLPPIADQIQALNITGIYVEPEYRRFYPEGEVTSQLVGLTNIDDQGQAGLELQENALLSGVPGKQEVTVNRMGGLVNMLKTIQVEQPGHDVVSSIDERIQYVADQVLVEAYKQYHPKFASIIVLNPKTGEVLAMVNQPSFNPNEKKAVNPNHYRNYALTDQFEPGSIMKVFAAINALDSGQYTPNSMVNTGNGRYQVDGHLVQDDGEAYGNISLTDILQKSSNVGISMVTLSLNPKDSLYQVLHRFGFGQTTGTGFPGEASGVLVDRPRWSDFGLATMSFGYSLSATSLQLAAAYAAIANEGLKMPISLIKQDPNHLPQGTQVVTPAVAKEVIQMLRSVVEPGGTGLMASINGYTVAGKTGTAYLAKHGGYAKDEYVSSFVGMAPASNPALVVAVVFYDVKGKEHFGGLLAGPAFSKVMNFALHIRNVAPDNLSSETPVK